MRKRLVVAAAALSFCTTFAPAQVQPLPKPCSILTAQEASAIVGAPVTADSSTDSAGVCTFKDAQHKTVLNVSGYLYPDAGTASENFSQLARVSGHATEPVSGTGDQAVSLLTAAGDVSLIMRKQSKVLLLSIVHSAIPDAAGHKPALLQAGKAAAGRL